MLYYDNKEFVSLDEPTKCYGNENFAYGNYLKKMLIVFTMLLFEKHLQ